MYFKITFLAFILGISQQIYSQTCCSGGVPLSNNLGLSNNGKGGFQLGVNYDYNNLNTLNAGSSKLNDDSRQRITNSILVNTNYAFTNQFSLETLFTWVNQTRTISQFGNENFTETSGIGDAVVLLKYRMLDVLGENTFLNLGTGVKVPLGKSDFTSEEGIQLTSDLQPGSGAWDGLGWLSFSKNGILRPSGTVSTSAIYRFTGVNSSYLNNTSTYEFGNTLQISAGYTDQLLIFNTIVNPGLVFKYRKSWSDKIDDSEIPNTGGNWVFVRPELNIQITPNFNAITKMEVPLYSYVEGTQLTPTFRVTAGLLLKINKKNKNSLNIK
ncbi:transporter [uncultured Maribacter sp.]|uniref:transporter n=1 Tax=uncultured Maribacter sp. TaxID=431308 RepID=UPI002638C6C5|nr:transporter [uncultured Maribacter sp.]